MWILFDITSLKMSLLCDMNSQKSFYYSLIWKELFENVSIVWYKLWKSVCNSCLPVTLWKCQYCLIMIWNLEMFVVLFGSLDYNYLDKFLKHIFEMGVNRKSDFMQDWKFCFVLFLFFFFIFLIGIHSMQGWTATTWHGVIRKKNTKILTQTVNLFKKNVQLKDVY